MLGVALALALQLPVAAPTTVPLSHVDRADPLVLAPQVLPPETASRVTGGWVRRRYLPSPVYRALFWEAAEPGPEGFCSRRVHVVELGNPSAGGTREPPSDLPLELKDLGQGLQYAPVWPRRATAAPCVTAAGYVAPQPANLEAELAMLRRLTDAMTLAAARGPLPFELTCTGEDPDACANPRAALAGLPLEALLGVRLRSNQFRDEPVENGVRVRYAQPVADGRWPEAEIEFDYSGRGGRSWTVTLKGVDRLESIDMRRTTIIRH